MCQGEAVQLVADGVAPKLQQPAEGATYEPIAKKDIAKVMRSPTSGAVKSGLRSDNSTS